MTTTQPTGYDADDAALLGALIVRLNPAWDRNGVWAALRKHAADPTPFADTCAAAITAAADPANHRRSTAEAPNTPERIWFAGPHWPERAKAALPRTPCPQHREEDEHTCRCCAADRLAANTTNAGQSTLTPPATCQDHPNQPAGTCTTCWAEVQNGARRRNHIGRHNPQGHS